MRTSVIAGLATGVLLVAIAGERQGQATRSHQHHVTTLHPGKNWYPVEQQTSNEVSIYHDPRNVGDLFTILPELEKALG